MARIRHCKWCGKELKEAPTDNGWIEHEDHDAICFSCIDELFNIMSKIQNQAIQDVIDKL